MLCPVFKAGHLFAAFPSSKKLLDVDFSLPLENKMGLIRCICKLLLCSIMSPDTEAMLHFKFRC